MRRGTKDEQRDFSLRSPAEIGETGGHKKNRPLEPEISAKT